MIYKETERIDRDCVHIPSERKRLFATTVKDVCYFHLRLRFPLAPRAFAQSRVIWTDSRLSQ
jgi:hypothetical protein